MFPSAPVLSDHHRPRRFPEGARAWPALESELLGMKALDYDWRRGRLPSYTYFFDEELARVQMDAYRLYAIENGLGEGLAFKSLTRMLEDLQAMLFDLFHAPAEAGFSFTSGGTESLFEAVRTARKHFRQRRGLGSTVRLNIVAPVSAHATLDKAAESMDLDVRRLPLTADWRADVAAMAAAMDEHTVMLFASAPCYPYGVFDPIAELGRLALRRDTWLHVDGCWGGFVSPFAKELGYPIPDWDLAVPGVTSLSADIHKFGYSAKGASALIFRDKAMLGVERFEFSGWPRGTYITPSFLGSRPAGAIASAWAVMQYLGRPGYLRTTKATMDATDQLITGIDAIEGLQCLRPNRESNLYAYTSVDPEVDIMAVADILLQQGWLPGRLSTPLAIQQGVNPVHLAVADEYLEAVEAAVARVRFSGSKGVFNARSY